MASSTLVNGRAVLETAMNFRNGQMEPNLKVNGGMALRKGSESLSMLTVTSTKGSGKATKRMVRVCTIMLMVRGMLDSGETIKRKGKP
mmetsp:Transcript_59604/g.94313  ORF Transcript_59604/g.94313 Transcript_59604/m.94313 type:complete len:88 (-) Transcript_59604:559-822(-)